MTPDDFLKEYIKWERYGFYRSEAFIHGEEYVIKNAAWIERDFSKYLERMSDDEKEKRIRIFINTVNAIRKEGDK